ncbi:thymidylate kinase [Pelagirhabdus alkalitolerans]|uniref:Thymidylate kinase n=1 Tax=Pelagirhabdus alkalitolerans TaxID=1612202 RepID=A0A1G6ML69_9BACI|nr:dTMP kinase [Pelagirhabdus alkalitolerans]SDC56283.1 thymidylate kinase [Pelagirhabdus alkalitolerans]
MAGFFITFEGGEGAGKTTVLSRVANQLKEAGYSVITTREPGGIPIAEDIRNVILNREHKSMDARTEALLYAAARRQHLVEKVEPALTEGKVVLCDRFIDSSLAYQGYARGIGMDDIYNINEFAIENLMPSLTLFFDLPPEIGLARIMNSKHREKNRLDEEEIEFHEAVYEGYQQVQKLFPSRIEVLDANEKLEKVVETAYRRIVDHISKK